MFWRTWVVQWFALSYHIKGDLSWAVWSFFGSYNNRSNFLVLKKKKKVFFITKCFIVSLFEQNGSSTDSPRKHSCCFCVHICMHLFSLFIMSEKSCSAPSYRFLHRPVERQQSARTVTRQWSCPQPSWNETRREKFSFTVLWSAWNRVDHLSIISLVWHTRVHMCQGHVTSTGFTAVYLLQIKIPCRIENN